MKWQYTSKTVRNPNIPATILNTFGRCGWELVSITSHMDKQMNFLTTAYFKKPIERCYQENDFPGPL